MNLKVKKSKVVPISISNNGRFFLDKNKEPFFWLGDTQWQLYRLFSPADAKEILKNRKEKGFNVILVMIIGYLEGIKPNINGDLPWKELDPSKPNEKYFEYIDKIMQIACELDFVQVVGVYHKAQEKYFNNKKAKEWAKWLGKRYKHVPHIIWSMYPKAEKRFIPVVKELARGLQEGDGGAHMITVHPDPSPHSSSFIHKEKWLDFNSIQTCNDLELLYPMIMADYSRTPIKPVVMAEGGYEGLEFKQLNTPLDIRKQAYWTYLAGGYHVYGHNDHYQVPDNWKSWIDSPGSFHIGVFKQIITSLKQWWDIIPDQSIIAKGAAGGRELNSSACSASMDWALIYLSSKCKTSIRMDRIKTSDKVGVSWINPVNGEKTRINSFRHNEIKDFSTPEDWEDALLLLEAA